MIIIYTDLFIPEQFAAYTYGPIILIRPAYRGDVGLIAHEREHVKQWLSLVGIVHWLLYTYSRRYRLWAEVTAYRIQLLHSPEHALLYAQFIATKYNLGITQEEAYVLLTN